VVVMDVSMADGVFMRRGRPVMFMIVATGFPRLVLVPQSGTVFVRRRRLDGQLQRRFFLDGVLVFVLRRMVVIVSRHKRRIARLPPQDPAAGECNPGQSDAAEQHIQVKLHSEQVFEHVGLPEPQAQTYDAERSGEADHAKLINEIGVRLVVRMTMIVGGTVFMAMIVMMRLVRHRNTTSPHR
jgi:hypothetical protein